MKAIILKNTGSIENLSITNIPIPGISDDEVLVQVKAISINPVDVKARAYDEVFTWIFDDKKPVILGWDISGIVREAGNRVTEFKKGDEVFGMVNFIGSGKAYAEYVAAPASQLALKPANISHQEAAAAGLAALTAWQAFKNAGVKAGDKVLIHAAAGGVGHYAVQMAKYLGAYVIGTSSANNRDFVLSLGADEHIDYKNERFEEIVRDADFVLDSIGGETFERSLEVVRKNGAIISIPQSLSDAELEKAKSKNVNAYFMLVASNGNDMKEIARLLEGKIITSYISKSFPFEEMGAAHLQLETGKTRGKVVLTLE